MKFLVSITIGISLFSSLLVAQDSNRDQQQNRLQQIRKEIEGYRQKIRKEERREGQLLDALAQLEQDIDLTHKFLSELEAEQAKTAKQINQTSRELETTRDELKRLQDIYAKRVVSFYKYGRMKDIELLLYAKSFNQTLIWFKFQKLISENDRRNFQNIVKKKQKIETERNKLKKDVIAHRKIINEKRDEEKRLRNKSKERNKLLADVRENKQIFLQRLEEYKRSMREIQLLISKAEDRRINLEQEGIVQTTNFPELKRRMIWPTRGKILNHFGRYKHPRWKTVTLENIGIDIQADFGQEVKATAGGIVTAITWQRGIGNVVMINHLGGYFTVYAHLSQIFVQTDETVETGQVIGSVGDSGSLSGPMLHFEIWKNKQALDPEKWLY